MNKKYIVGATILLIILIVALKTVFTVSSNEVITFATWNLEWFFDNDLSDNMTYLSKQFSDFNEEEYKYRLEVTAEAIAKMNPTILALQEIENQKVVQDLSDVLKEKYNLEFLVGFIQGKDTYTEQDVAFLIQNVGIIFCRQYNFMSYTINICVQKKPVDIKFSRVESLGFDFNNRELYMIPSKHLALNVILKSKTGDIPLTIITAHLKSGTASNDELQRKKQSRVIHKWASDLISKGNAVVLLGDFNDNTKLEQTTSDTPNGILCGLETPTIEDDLIDLNVKVSPEFRKTHISGGEIDRIIVSPNLLNGNIFVFDSISNYRHLVVKGGKSIKEYPKEERDLSDHYPLGAKFKFAR